MPTTINASNTSGGAIITPDGSGVLELQSGGVTALTVSGANVTVAGTLAATGGINISGGITGTLPVANGGTGAVTLTGVIKGNGTSAFTASTVSLTTEVSGTLPVGNGGTGATTLAANNVLLGNGTSAVQAVAPGTASNVLTSNGTTWTSAPVPTTSPGGTTGQVQVNNAGAFGAIASGTAGQVLTSGGASVAPSFTTLTASGLVLLSTTNVTGNPTAIDITSGFSSTYNDYMLIYSNLTLNTTEDLKLRFFKNSTIITTNTYTSESSFSISSSPSGAAQGTESRIDINKEVSSTNIAQGVIYILGTDQSRTVGIGQNGTLGPSYFFVNNITFANTASGTFSGLRFLSATGTATFSSGVFKLYGIAKS